MDYLHLDSQQRGEAWIYNVCDGHCNGNRLAQFVSGQAMVRGLGLCLQPPSSPLEISDLIKEILTYSMLITATRIHSFSLHYMNYILLNATFTSIFEISLVQL